MLDFDGFIDLWRRSTPPEIVALIENKPGFEIYQMQAYVFAYLGRKLDNLLSQMRANDASGPEHATGKAKLIIPEDFPFAFSFAPYKLTLWGLKHGGKNLVPYHNTETVAFTYGSGVTEIEFDVKAVRPGIDQDILKGKLCVLFANGENKGSGKALSSTRVSCTTGIFSSKDVGRIIKLSDARGLTDDVAYRQISSIAADGSYCVLYSAMPTIFYDRIVNLDWEVLDLADLGLMVTNDADIEGGNFYMLDLILQDQEVYRMKGETDAQYLSRAKTQKDTVSPPAIQRALDRIMLKCAPGYSAVLDDVMTDPINTAFFSDTGDELTENTLIFDDPRDNPAQMCSLKESHGFFLVKVPVFADKTDAEKAFIYGSIYATVENIRMGGVSWEMIQDANLG